MSKRKTAPTKATRPAVSETLKWVDPRNYPPDDLPEIAQGELRALTQRPEPSDEDIELRRREDQRANRKIGYFKALTDRPDAEAREASAVGTVALANIDVLMKHGAKAQKGRRRGGETTGEKKHENAEANTALIVEAKRKLIESGNPKPTNKQIARGVAIASGVTLNADTVRKKLKKRT